MAKYLSNRNPFGVNANHDLIREIQNLSLAETIQWLKTGDILLDPELNHDQIGALSVVAGIDLSSLKKAEKFWWLYCGDECLAVKLKNYSRKDKPPFSRTKAEFVLVKFHYCKRR